MSLFGDSVYIFRLQSTNAGRHFGLSNGRNSLVCNYSGNTSGESLFDTLKNSGIANLSLLDGTDFASCNGRESEVLVESICDKISDLKMGCPHFKKNANYRWNVRVHKCS
jgi:hypothetical protein